MHVTMLRIRLRLPSRTLKEKRSIVKSVLSRARNRFNVACTEADLHDQPDDTELAFVTVSDTTSRGRGVLQELEQWLLDERPDVEVVDILVEEL